MNPLPSPHDYLKMIDKGRNHSIRVVANNSRHTSLCAAISKGERMKTHNILLATASAAAALFAAAPAQAQDLYIGQVFAIATEWCPRGSIEAAGQTLSIRDYTALFALIGFAYGGDRTTNFVIPDLRGRVIVDAGTGPGLTNLPYASSGGAESVVLSVAQMPSHQHGGAVQAGNTAPTTPNPAGNTLANWPSGALYSTASPSIPMANGTVQTTSTGGGQAVSIRNPYVAMRYCIVVQGIYPNRP